MADTYVKLEDGKLVYPPKDKGNIFNYNLAGELLKEDGYKLLIKGTTEEGKKYHETFEETEDTITQIFTEFTAEEYAEAEEQEKQEIRVFIELF